MKVNLRNDNNKDKIINSTENAVKSTSLNVFDLIDHQSEENVHTLSVQVLPVT